VDGTAQTTGNGLARTQLTVTLDHDYMQIVAHYFTTTLDSDTDGIRDWIEWRHFGGLDKTTADDPDGDTFTIGAEQTRGYSLVVPDLMEEGGVFRSASASVEYRNPDVYKFYLIGTDPSGLFLETNVVLPGTEITTSNQYGPLQTYTFGYWTVNGTRQASVNGIALTRLTLTVNQDLNIIGHFLLTNEDSDGDGIADWVEWFYFGSLAYNQISNPDADGYDVAWEMSHGLNIAVADIVEEGGVSRSASRTVSVYNPAVYVPYVIHSEPEGLIAREEGLVEPGETVQTPLLHGSTQGYTFAYWSVNGARQAAVSGRALDRVSAAVSAPTAFVAHYFADNADTDADTLKDAFEWMEFGDLDETPASDPDGDGRTIGQEAQLGFAPRIADITDEGGVFRSASKSVNMQLAAYNIYHQLTVNIDPPGGGSVHGGGQHKQGIVATLEATVPPGVNGMFSHWTGDINGTDNPAHIVMDGPHSVTAHFTVAAYSLKYAAGSHGTLSGSTSQSVAPGDDGTPVEAVPETGWHFDQWSDGVTQNPRTDTNVNAPVDVAALFAINVYPVNYEAGPHGSISGTASQNVEHGASGSTVEAVPDTGWHFVNWSDGATQNQRTDTNITGPLSLTANFAINVYAVNYAAGAHGSISGTASQSVEHGEASSAVTAVPATGYHFTIWSDGSSQNPRTDTNVTGPLSVTASFAINYYAVTFDLGTHGTRTGGGDLSQNIAHGSGAVAPTVSAEAHWRFTGWDVAFDNITGPLTVTAQYERITHEIAASASPAEGGIVSGTGVYNETDTATVTATRKTGWKFLRWTEDGTEVSGSAAYSFEVANPRTLVAHFEPLEISIDPDTATKDLEAQSYDIAVTCNGAWSVAESLAWAGVAPTSGTGSGTVTVTLTQNNNALARSGTMTFSCTEAGSVAHAITQHGGEIELSQSHAGFAKTGGTGSVGVITSHYGLAWTAASNDPWLHVVTGATGSGNGSVSYSVDAYDGLAPREGTITIGGNAFTVMQSAAAPNGQLVVHVSGSGTVSGATPGVPVTKPVGKPVTITAKPLAGHRFAGWTGSGFVFPPGGETALKLTFMMGENVDITANFEPDPYADGKLAGSYVGLAVGPDESDLANNGLCSVSLTTTGAFTCSVITGSGKYSGKGILTSGSEGRVLLKLKGREPIHLGLFFDAPAKTVNVVARLAGEIGPVLWSADAVKIHAGPKGSVHPCAGPFTAVLRSGTGAPVKFGAGYTTITVGADGSVRLAGQLPDGTKLGAGAKLNVNNRWVLFLPLYKGGGFLGGEVNAGALTSMSGALHFVKKPVAPGAKDSCYRAGFDTDLDFDAEKYAPPVDAPALDVPLTAGNLRFTASGGGLVTDPLVRLVTLDAANKLAAPVDATKLTLKLNAKTGLFTASFVHDATLKAVKGAGVLLQDTNAGAGLFIGTSETGPLSLDPVAPPP
jgi:hypothetical protein